jgi:hypothetical protein
MSTTNVTTAMSDAFARIRWSVFEDISKIRIDRDDEENSHAELEPFIGHPIGAEAASEVPLHEITLSIVALDEYEGDIYEAPSPVLIRRKDGGIVTVGDVVEQLAPHLVAHKKEILEAKAPFLNISPEDIPANTRVFFDQFFGIITPGLNALGVELWAEGEDDESFGEHFNHLPEN